MALRVVVGLFSMWVNPRCGRLARDVVASPAVPSSGPWYVFLDCCVVLGPFVFSFGVACRHWDRRRCIVMGIGFRARQGGAGL